MESAYTVVRHGAVVRRTRLDQRLSSNGGLLASNPRPVGPNCLSDLPRHMVDETMIIEPISISPLNPSPDGVDTDPVPDRPTSSLNERDIVETMSRLEAYAQSFQANLVDHQREHLWKETIRSQLKTRTYVEEACVDGKTESCIICYCDFKKKDDIATLNCGHEYHARCLKKWLLVKNSCPMCRASALTA